MFDLFVVLLNKLLLVDCAKLIESNSNLNLNSGMLVCVPIPIQHEANGSMIEETIQVRIVIV